MVARGMLFWSVDTGSWIRHPSLPLTGGWERHRAAGWRRGTAPWPTSHTWGRWHCWRLCWVRQALVLVFMCVLLLLIGRGFLAPVGVLSAWSLKPAE